MTIFDIFLLFTPKKPSFLSIIISFYTRIFTPELRGRRKGERPARPPRLTSYYPDLHGAASEGSGGGVISSSGLGHYNDSDLISPTRTQFPGPGATSMRPPVTPGATTPVSISSSGQGRIIPFPVSGQPRALHQQQAGQGPPHRRQVLKVRARIIILNHPPVWEAPK